MALGQRRERGGDDGGERKEGGKVHDDGEEVALELKFGNLGKSVGG